MKRRDFFKGIFGAAIVAAIPKPIMEQLDKISDETLIPKVHQISIKPIINTVPLDSSSRPLLLLYDNSKLIGTSCHFELTCNRPLIKETEQYYPTFTLGLSEWNIMVNKMNWVDKKRGLDYFERNEPFQCTMKSPEGMLFQGDVLLTDCALTIFDSIEEDIVLKGNGALTIETE